MSSFVGNVYTLYLPGKERITDRSLSRYWSGRSTPETPWNIGFVRQDQMVKMHLYNGEDTPMTLTGISYVDALGIEVTDPIDTTLPIILDPFTGLWIDVSIYLNGPTLIETYITFETDKGNSVFHIYGIRAPYLDGTIATLFHKHNWASGFIETLEWKTQVLFTYSGKEQRISLLPLPRRSYALQYIEEKNTGELLETYLSARNTDFYLIPTWHDVGGITKPAPSGSTEVWVDTSYRDYTANQKIALWNSDGEMEVYTILDVLIDKVTILAPLESDFAIDSTVAPVRPYYVDESFTYTKVTDSVAKYDCNMKSVYDTEFIHQYLQDMYESYEVFPLDLNFIEQSDTVSHKWEILDNTIGLPQIVKESLNPLRTLNSEVLATNRDLCGRFISFLHNHRGKTVPFFLLGKGNVLYPLEGLVAGNLTLKIEFANYTDDILGETGKSHIQILFADGTYERYKIIGSSTNPALPDEETINVSPAFLTNRSKSEIVSISYLQLCRFATDIFQINWENTDVLRCKFQVNVII